MRSTPFSSLFVCLLLASVGVQAQTAAAAKRSKVPEPMLQVIKKAVGTNPDVQAKFNGFLSAGNLRDIARAGFLPQLNLSASAGTENRTTPTVPNSTYNVTSGQLSANQILFDGFFTASEFNRLSAGAQTRYFELVEAAEAVALESFKAYADVVRARELVSLATDNYSEHKQSALLVEERANSGVGRGVDLEQANGRLAQAESNLLVELANLHSVSARYLRVVGEKPAASLPTLPEPFTIGELPANTEAMLRDGIQNSPTLLAAVQNARAGKLATLTSKSAFMPRVDLQAYASQGDNNNSVAGNNQATGAALALSYNLFKGGSDVASGKLAGYNADQARDLQNKACNDVRQVLSLAYSDVRSLTEKLDYEDRHRLSSEKTREAYRQQFEIGQRTLLDVLDTQNEFFEASRSYTNARHDQATAQARTLAAMGTLVSALGASRSDMPEAKEGGDEDRADLNKFCEGSFTVVDTVENIKAGLNIAKPVKTSSYVVLLPDSNNVVGKVIVEGAGGKQVLEEAQKGVKADGGGGTFAVSEDQLKRDFGSAMQARPQVPERFVLYFLLGTNVLTSESKALLPKIVEQAAKRPGLDVSVIGHTDSYGSDQINEVLGRQRATFVTQELRKLGLKTETLEIESFGKRDLLVPTPDNTREARNRRVEVTLR